MRRIHWRVLAMVGVVALALLGAGAPVLADPLPLPPGVSIPIPLGGATSSPAAPAADPPSQGLVNVGPQVQLGVCGNGVGVLGQGSSTASCGGQSTNLGVGHADSSALVNVSPTIQVGLCGNGAGVLGVGTTSDCSGQQGDAKAGNGGLL